jgi:hypothetical protein
LRLVLQLYINKHTWTLLVGYIGKDRMTFAGSCTFMSMSACNLSLLTKERHYQQNTANNASQLQIPFMRSDGEELYLIQPILQNVKLAKHCQTESITS